MEYLLEFIFFLVYCKLPPPPCSPKQGEKQSFLYTQLKAKPKNTKRGPHRIFSDIRAKFFNLEIYMYKVELSYFQLRWTSSASHEPFKVNEKIQSISRTLWTRRFCVFCVGFINDSTL
jgi:hypothetical protein